MQQATSNIPQLLTEKEAARVLTVSIAALRRWRRERRGPQFSLFHTSLREPFARVWVKDHWETYRIKSDVFEERLFAMCYYAYGAAPTQIAVTAARRVLAADALFQNDERKVDVRVAGYDGAIYVDLANDRWEAVKITCEGWEIVPHVPV